MPKHIKKSSHKGSSHKRASRPQKNPTTINPKPSRKSKSSGRRPY